MPKNYKHDVDIRSSQVGRAAKDAKKFGKELYDSLAGLGFIIIFFGIIWAIGYSTYKRIESDKLSKNAPALNLTLAARDYAENSIRYSQDWEGEYFSYYGQIKSFASKYGSNSIEFVGGYIPYRGSNQPSKLICSLKDGQKDKASTLNIGNMTEVTGKLSGGFIGYRSDSGWVGDWEFTLDDCRFK